MFASLLTLAACDGDGSSSFDEKNDSSIAEVESFDDLVHCTKSHFGEVRRVLEIDSIYQCTADGWVAIDSSEISNSSSSLAKSSTGWHIPSVAEYETLINYVQSVAGVDSLGKNFISVSGWKYAKAVSGWHLYDMAGWDSFGFNLLQAGFGTKDGSGYDYYPLQNSDQGSSMLWASDEYAGTKDVSYEAYLLKVQTDKTGNVSVQTDFWPKDGIHSVRCIKN